MAEGRFAVVNESFDIWHKHAYNVDSLYPQATVYAPDGTLFATVDLDYVAASKGLYKGSFTPNVPGSFAYEVTWYSDSGHTTEDPAEGGDNGIVYVDHKLSRGPASSVGGGIDSSQIDKIVDKIWEKMLDDERSAGEVLLSRSDFNPETDIVKTEVNFDEVVSRLTKNIAQVVFRISRDIEKIPTDKQKDYSKEFVVLKKNIQKVSEAQRFGHIIESVNHVKEELVKAKTDIIQGYPIYDYTPVKEIDAQLKILAGNIRNEIGNIKMPEFDYSHFGSLKDEVKSMVNSIEKPKDYTNELDNILKVARASLANNPNRSLDELGGSISDLDKRLQTLESLRTLMIQIQNIVRTQHSQLLQVMDMLAKVMGGRTDKILGNQANTISAFNQI